jgi:hypothetical protein
MVLQSLVLSVDILNVWVAAVWLRRIELGLYMSVKSW